MIKKQENAEQVRIVFKGQCKKLTARGVGLLAYELGTGVNSDACFIRISGNETSGTCSFEWIKLETIENLLKQRPESDKPFNAKLFQKAFISRSVNNHGYLAAVLKSEGVISSSAENPTLLSVVSFTAIRDRISALTKDGIDLTDHIALEQAGREKKRAEQSKSTKSSKVTAETTLDETTSDAEKPESIDQTSADKAKAKRIGIRKNTSLPG